MKNPARIAHIATLSVLIFVALWGAAMVLTPIKPFWIDEWRLLYNIKFKTPAELWGHLRYTQQFPRVYLQAVKWFTAQGNYSYTALRTPGYIVTLLNMLLCYHLMKRIYPLRTALRYLFVLILISSQTFTDYIVQIKQYEMEILLSLVALWQYLELTDILAGIKRSTILYFLLLLSMMVSPFFSYTYSIALMPVFIIAGLRSISLLRSSVAGSMVILARTWLPLALSLCSIAWFYKIDVSHVLADEQMHQYWKYRMMGDGFSLLNIIEKLWLLFAEVGSGLLFEIIFGILGIAAFSLSIARTRNQNPDAQWWLRAYTVVLLLVVIALFLLGKLPIGEPKFNAFTVPSLAILIIYLLSSLVASRYSKVGHTITVILFLGLTGNIISTFINNFGAPEYARRIDIYKTTEAAIRVAIDKQTPIITTPAVAWPDKIYIYNPYLESVPGSSVLKTFPAFPATSGVPVYDAPDSTRFDSVLQSLPANIHTVIIMDGTTVATRTR